ncbi:SusC/RagA family TonB-linked outer membrane protein [Paraflavitalea pollutisoli]|uniref:SusC/RagA family TonB-linked outer membrane protein n=1 Tax=Paraflavitalea pollutisoli TaxID=3034143 RepID=UPI0023EE22D4|nr:SusC/RagA family TonB-linked outer membrane protein [Paraflavitalea sp. H1-2-19X]
MRKILPLLAVLVCIAYPALSQTRLLTGRITDITGSPVAFASVVVKSSKVGTTSDENGGFKINVASGDVLVVTAVGMKPAEYTVGSGDMAAIRVERVSAMDEVVVTAMGIRREKKALGYAVQEVKGENVTVAKSLDVSSSLAGKVAGVQLVGSPSSTYDNAEILIRGVTGLGPQPPIFVVDGTITSQSAVIMDNIDNISVLKGPAATALYGQRAANGAVIITTKKGTRKRVSGVDVNLGVTMEKLSIIPPYQNQYAGGYSSNYTSKRSLNPSGWTGGDYLDDQGYYIFRYDPSKHPASWASFEGQRMLEYGADESWGPKIDGSQYRPYYSWYPGDEFGKTFAMVAQPNNVKDFFETGVNLNNSISFYSGGETYNFRATYGNQNRTLVLPNSKRDQNQFGVNGAVDVGKYITVSTDITYSASNTKGKPLEGYRLDGLNIQQNFNQWFQRQLDIKRMKRYRESDGSLNSWNIGDPNATSVFSEYSVPQYWDNPYFVVNENYGTQRNNRLVGNVGLNIKFNNHWNLQSYARINSYGNENDFRVATGGLNLDGYELLQNNYREMNYESNLYYKNKFGVFSLDGLVGGNIRQEYYSQLSEATAGGLSAPNYFDLRASISRPTALRSYAKKRVNSIYGKVSVGYDDIIFLEGTLRNDWSSALPVNDNSYLYPSVSTSFIFTELLKTSGVTNTLTFGKLRLSYASVGSDLDPHQLNTAINIGSFYGSNPSTAIGDRLRGGKIEIKPSLTSAYEAGIELRFFNRFGLDVAVYQNNNTDQILPVDVSSSSGFSSVQINAGKIVSQGIEISLNATPVASRDFSWDITLNWARNSNKVKELYPGLPTYLYATNRYDTRLEHRVDAEWGMYVGRKWRTDPATGQTLINYSVNSAGTKTSTGLPEYDINQDIGQVLPEWTGGMFNAMKFKGFDLTFSIDFQSGGLFYSETRNFNTGAGLSEETVGLNDKGHDWRDYPGSWTFANGNTGSGGILIPGVFNDGKGTVNNRYVAARAYWYTARQMDARNVLLDASYIKLREVRFGYSLPVSVLRHLKVAKSVNLGIIVQNAWLIWANTKKYGVDPSELEVFYREGGQLSATRQIGANLRVSF